MDELLDGPIGGIASAIRTGEIKSATVVNAFLERIERVNPTLNAAVLITREQAMKHAEKADVAISKGEPLGPLHGVPMTIKDSLDTKDAVTTWGTKGRHDFRPGRDATCVARLREAGAILIAKTNTPEFTLSFRTSNLLFGRTNNPYDVNRTPGGSSGGAAALLAANATPFDIGTDTAGSIRLPSHFSGICGLKPTRGSIPCTGNALPTSGLLAPLTQPGPMARRATDLACLFDIMKGPDHQDPHAVLAGSSETTEADLTALSVAYFADNGLCSPDAEISAAVESIRDLAAESGCRVSEARPTGIEMTQVINTRLFTADGQDMVSGLLEDARTEEPSPEIKAMLDTDSPFSGPEFGQIIAMWHNYQSSMLGFWKDFDLLVCPVNAHTAPLHEETYDSSAFSYTSAFNLTGWPAAVVRVGTDVNGLPIGIQIVAPPFREDRCLAMACWIESQCESFQKPAISA